MKKAKIEIIQKDGVITISRNGEVETRYNMDRAVELIASGKMTSVGLANMIAEIMYDCLNCKSATASLKDLNETDAYQGTYFETID